MMKQNSKPPPLTNEKTGMNLLPERTLRNKKILITGCAGFIGSNLTENMLNCGNTVVGLDNLSTGFFHNMEEFLSHENFSFIEGDIRDLECCQKAAEGAEYIFHQAALGSVPRSINDPVNTNTVNISGFLNMLVAARDHQVKRFIYAASSSTYGDLDKLLKIEKEVGAPLSPYAVTKLVNELYAHVFGLNYGLECIGLRYFNVFGRKQTPNGAYAAVIPKFVDLMIQHKSPVINGDGSISRDFVYIENVIQMNHLAASTTNKQAIGQVFNTAIGERSDLNELFALLKEGLSKYDAQIAKIQVEYGPLRSGDIPHSLASIEKAKSLLAYSPSHYLQAGLEETIAWYWENRASSSSRK